jgi:hypothetical protein
MRVASYSLAVCTFNDLRSPISLCTYDIKSLAIVGNLLKFLLSPNNISEYGPCNLLTFVD